MTAEQWSRTKSILSQMAIDPALISYFTAVAQCESISRAADKMAVSGSTVSRKIDEIEDVLGVRLFERDTRHLRLTEAGNDFLYYAQQAIHLLGQGEQAMASYNKEVRGSLRIWCPPAFGREFLASTVAHFGAAHPLLNISLQLEARPFALGSSEFDIGICVGMPTEGRVVISRVCSFQSSYVATPKFFKKHGIPQTMHDLVRMPIVTVFHEQEMNERCVIQSPCGQQVSYVSKLAVNDSELAMKAILSGEYIGKVMHWYAQCELLNATIYKVLPELIEEKNVYAMVQGRKGNPRKVQLFIDFFKSHMQPTIADLERRTACLPYWEKVVEGGGGDYA